MATGSVGNMNGPWIFVGETEGSAGAFRGVSKVYQGTAAPDLTVGTWGSTLNGTPFHASSDQTLYVLNNSGNVAIDLTGNIEGNVITNVEITNLTGSIANISNVSGSFTGSGIGLYDIPASGITGLELNRISDGSATASISQANGLRVNTKTEVTGSFTVTGNTYTVGDVLITGNTIQTGSIDLTGNIVLGGNITIGDQTTDIINFGGEVSSSIVPIAHNSFDLGSTDKNWRNLHVSGTAYVDTLQARQVNFSDLGILEDLTVSGSTYLGNGGDVLVVSGSAYYDSLTNNRIVIAGTDGLLEDDANFTFDGTELNVGQGNFTVQQSSGNIDTAGTLNVGGATTLESTLVVTGSSEFKNNVGVTGTLDVTGSTVLKSTLEGKGAVGFNSTLDVTGSATLKSTLEVKSATGLNSTLDVTGSTVLKSTLEGKGAVGFNSTLDVTGSTTLKSTLEAKGAVGFNSTLDVTGSTQFKDTINVDSEATLASATVEDLTDNRIVLAGTGGSLEDDINFTFDGTTFNIGQGDFEVDTDGDIRTSGSLTINKIYGNTTSNNSLHLNGGDLGAPDVELESAGQISLFSEGTGNNFAINMTGSVRMANDLSVTGSLTVSGSTTFNDDLTVNGILTVTGETRLQSNLYVSGNLEVLGSATNVNIQSNTVEIGDNIILVNAYSPFQRYAGITGYDSGSVGTSGSMLWDSLNDFWLLQNSDASTSKVIGTTTGSMGSEVSLTDTYFPIATSANTIGDSLLRYSGTTLSFNTNKFTIDSGTGDTAISGNLTLSYSGGTDAGSVTSVVMFRNSSNVVGYVSTTDTQNVTTQLLGYDASTGVLEFSSVIDGGTY
jgi:hypothetical protein